MSTLLIGMLILAILITIFIIWNIEIIKDRNRYMKCLDKNRNIINYEKNIEIIKALNRKYKDNDNFFKVNLENYRIATEEENITYKIHKDAKKFETKKNKKNISNKEKGDIYEEYISEYYRKLGYTVAQHGRDNGVLDNGIDIIAKKNKEIFFIQCKNWNKNNKFKIKSLNLKAIQTDVRNYLKKHAMYTKINYKMKILFVCSEDVYDKSAIYYANECKSIIELKIIPIKNT